MLNALHQQEFLMENKNLVIIVLVLVLAVGAYLWHKDQNTTTIDLPGNNQIEIEK